MCTKPRTCWVLDILGIKMNSNLFWLENGLKKGYRGTKRGGLAHDEWQWPVLDTRKKSSLAVGALTAAGSPGDPTRVALWLLPAATLWSWGGPKMVLVGSSSSKEELQGSPGMGSGRPQPGPTFFWHPALATAAPCGQAVDKAVSLCLSPRPTPPHLNHPIPIARPVSLHQLLARVLETEPWGCWHQLWTQLEGSCWGLGHPPGSADGSATLAHKLWSWVVAPVPSGNLLTACTADANVCLALLLAGRAGAVVNCGWGWDTLASPPRHSSWSCQFSAGRIPWLWGG